ncbi:MAG: hypothetical protein IJV29_05830 [Butyrivibrio sp.]|nr:hypothetical protein [Butyrivibrio sp.]
MAKAISAPCLLKEVTKMLFTFELIIVLIIIFMRYYKNNKEKCRIRSQRIVLKLLALVLSLLLAATVVFQELLQRLLNKISEKENILQLKDIF